jgi:hypothetical protein
MKQATYGIEGTKYAYYCANHKLENYVDIKHGTCKYINCKKLPTYGKKDSKRAEYCYDHKLENYIDIINKKCKFINCKKQPNFGLPNSNHAEYCFTHKLEGYINIKNKICKYENCKKYPIYGLPGSKLTEYCVKHAPNNYIDIKNKRCIYQDCNILASFGFPSYSKEYCFIHKLPNMIAKPTKVSSQDFKECSICTSKIHYAQEFCTNCKNYIKLGKTVKLHEKELAIKRILETNQIKFIHDSITDISCSKKRPDFRIDTKFGSIILEIDEFQHKRRNYSEICEITRMKQIFFDIGVEQLLFIRYNPDSYKPDAEEKEESNLNRQDYLIKYLKRMMDRDTLFDQAGGILITYLYYDGFNKSNNEEIYLNPYEKLVDDNLKNTNKDTNKNINKDTNKDTNQT